MPELSWTQSVHHDGSPRYVVASHLYLGENVTLRLRAGLEAPIERAFVRTTPDGEQAHTSMHPAGEDATCRWWEATLPLAMPRTNYRFWLMTPDGGWWLTAAGMLRHTPTDASDFVLLANYQAPAWAQDTVFYEIFPDRFADGDPANNVRTDEYSAYGRSTVARAWGERPRPHSDSGGIEFFGGDLQGITQKLDYLQDLGVTALYLTPIFTAPSNHKYDVADYMQVDPHFGGNAALAALRQALTQRGMRLMLDIVPNHCGATHHWFLKAQADPTSDEAEFFTFGKDRQHDYYCWLGVKSLPKLNYRSQKLRERVYAGEDAVMRHWMRPPYAIDGWRMDVANMLGRQGESQLGHKVVRGMRRAIKAERHDAYLLGENFYDGTPALQGDELDATMNYRGFSLPLVHWLASKDPATMYNRSWADPHPLPTEALAAQWTAFRAAIPWQIAAQQFHLLGSHDTARALTVLGGDETRLRVAATLLFTYPGVPCVYYGDEIGLPGGGDPDNRRCMPWDQREWNLDLRAWYQQMIRLRRTSPALRWGGFQMLHATGETIAFLREAPEERLLVVARRAQDGLKALPIRHAGLADGVRLREVQSGAEATITGGMLSLVSLPALGAQIWRAE
ncbi:MAG TPA: maltodextrin glucosidase [Ktedonobacterales bacterium]